MGGHEVVTGAAADSGPRDMASEGGDASRRTYGGEGVHAESGTVEPIFDVYKMTFPRLPQQFTGTGDLMAALLLAWTHRYSADISLAFFSSFSFIFLPSSQAYAYPFRSVDGPGALPRR